MSVGLRAKWARPRDARELGPRQLMLERGNSAGCWGMCSCREGEWVLLLAKPEGWAIRFYAENGGALSSHQIERTHTTRRSGSAVTSRFIPDFIVGLRAQRFRTLAEAESVARHAYANRESRLNYALDPRAILQALDSFKAERSASGVVLSPRDLGGELPLRALGDS